jgi:DCN1-like protein 3
LGRSGSNESKHGSEAKIASLFEKYRDKDFNNQEDAILTLGVEALCKDLELRPDEFRVLLLAWKCNAEQVFFFFKPGLAVLRANF